MNTTEIKTKGLIKSYADLFKYAKKQFLGYEKIEGIPDWNEHDFSIDCSEDQMRFKDMLQIRCVEELTEATHAMDNEDHFFEEVTDALNFFLSAYVMAGIDFSSLPSAERIMESWEGTQRIDLGSFEEKQALKISFYDIVDDIGDLCNLLKNRPWAQSNYLVSMLDFDARAKKLWVTFWDTLGRIGITDEELFDLFERKYLVNLWRIKTGY